jgi:hypothetical protein
MLSVAAVWALAGTAAENLAVGQLNPLLLFLALLALRLWRRANDRGAAVVLGVATALKVWPAVYLALPALERRWRRAAIGLAGAGVTFAILWAPLLAFPPPHAPQGPPFWLGSPAPLNFSLPAVALRIADPPRGRGPLPSNWMQGNLLEGLELDARHGALAVALSLAVLSGGFALLFGRARVVPRQDLALFGAVTALTLAAAPIAWYHYYLMVFPALAFLAHRRASRRAWAALVRLAAIGAGLTWSHGLLFGNYVARHGWTSSEPAWLWLALSTAPVLAVVLFVLLLREIASAAGEAPEAGPPTR